MNANINMCYSLLAYTSYISNVDIQDIKTNFMYCNVYIRLIYNDLIYILQ